MNIFSRSLTLCCLFILSACNLVDLEDPGNEDPLDAIQIPTSIPNSVNDFNQAFHGGMERTWTTLTFQLAGFEGFQDCRLDDTMLIKADGTYEYNGGDVLCGAEDNTRIKSGTWMVINGGANVIFDQGLPHEYIADVDGFENGIIAFSGQYVGLTIRGVYQLK